MPSRWISTACFIAAIGLASLLILVPSTGPDKPGILALLLMIAGLIGMRNTSKLQGRWGFWLMLLPSAAIMFPMIVVVRAFRRLDMVSLLFHATADMAGAGVEGLHKEIIQAALLTFVLVASLYGLARLWSLRTRGIAALALFLLAINPLTIGIAKLVLVPKPKSDLAQRFTLPTASPTLANPVDLLMIYLEGTDRQFADTALWGDVYAPLQAIADEGVVFTRLGQIVGTGWSLAGVAATQCGVPLVPNGLFYGTNFEDLNTFTPGVRCLGDVLSDHDYSSIFINGAKERWGGMDKLFETHGFTQMIGRETLDGMFDRAELDAALIGWMLDDQLVLDAADKLHARMAAAPEPYALVVETVGPHGSNNFISRNCNADGRSGFSSDLRLGLTCTIKDTVALVAKVRARQTALRPDRPLLIVLASDHLNHSAAAPKTAAEFAGFNTFIMAGASLPAGQKVDKLGSMIDVTPTQMQAMGLIKPPYADGLGVSLLAGEPSLVERHGIDQLEPMVLFDTDLATRIWTPLKPMKAGLP